MLHLDKDTFYLFLECCLNRTYTVAPNTEHDALEITVNIPLPPDDLFHKAGLANASAVVTKKSEEIFTLKTPRQISRHHREIIHYPNEETRLWIIFKYGLEKPIENEQAVKIKTDLISKLVNAK